MVDPKPADLKSDNQTQVDVPKAIVRSDQQVVSNRLKTRLWWLTGLCVLLAIALLLTSFRTQGLNIRILFAEGHGLKAGDTLRYRGIDIGAVQTVQLSDDLDRVSVQVLLSPGNEAIAVADSQFWIERPRLKLGQISGLDTVLGAKYLGVLPGDASGERVLEFQGLESPLMHATQSDSREILVRFETGEGLGIGDAVRFRGISVGEVTDVELGDDGQSVGVRLRLIGAAQRLARAGTQFWVERPRLDLTEVRGLDTIFSGQYVAMQPTSETGEVQSEFVGLADPPPLPLRDGSLEIELDASSRMGVTRAAPISYRGLEVGRVSNVGLSSDGATVKIRAVIDAEYSELVRSNSKWWSNGGIQIDAKLSGVEIAMDSVSAWLRGGIEFSTPEDPGKRVVTGHRFVLEPEPLPEWLDWQARIAVNRLGGLRLPNTVRVVASWNASIVALYRRRTTETWAVALSDGYLRVPTAFADEAEAVEKEVNLELAGHSAAWESSNILRAKYTTRVRIPPGALVPQWPADKLGSWSKASVLMIVNPELPEPLAIDDTRVAIRKGVGLSIASGVPIADSLVGSPVLDATTGNLIGLLVREGESWIVASLLDSP